METIVKRGLRQDTYSPNLSALRIHHFVITEAMKNIRLIFNFIIHPFLLSISTHISTLVYTRFVSKILLPDSSKII
jgi:hypothetical protein